MARSERHAGVRTRPAPVTDTEDDHPEDGFGSGIAADFRQDMQRQQRIKELNEADGWYIPQPTGAVVLDGYGRQINGYGRPRRRVRNMTYYRLGHSIPDQEAGGV